MTIVNLNVNRREYQMECEDGQEQHLVNLSLELDARVKDLSKIVGTGNQTLLVVVAALQLIDELQQARLGGAAPVNIQDQIDKIASATISQVTDKIDALTEKLERKIA